MLTTKLHESTVAASVESLKIHCEKSSTGNAVDNDSVIVEKSLADGADIKKDQSALLLLDEIDQITAPVSQQDIYRFGLLQNYESATFK